MNAVLVVDKYADLTLRDVVNRVRWITKERSIDHLGTLDRMATGVLPLLLGRYTRLAPFFKESLKIYEGEIRFGYATDTYDAEGLPVGQVTRVTPTLDEIHRHLPRLVGEILQVPPNYTPKKIRRAAAYKWARKEKPVEMKAVPVKVYRFEILTLSGDRARFVAEVSPEAYVRALAHDLGQFLGCGAHISQLRRTKAGEFDLSQALTLNDLEAHFAGLDTNEFTRDHPRQLWVHPRAILPDLPNVTASPEAIAYLSDGRSVDLPESSEAPLIKVFSNQNDLFAIGERVAGTTFRPTVVIR